MMEELEVPAICNSVEASCCKAFPFKAINLSSARALLLACKSNAVQQVMLTCYKEEAKAFAQNSRHFSRDIPEPPVPPATRCRMRRGGGRCRGAVSEVSIAQMCAYHQVRRISDLRLDRARGFFVQELGRVHEF